MSLRTILPASICLIVLVACSVAAQETVPQTPATGVGATQPGPERQRRRALQKPRMDPGRRESLRQLNLSDEQRQQQRAILQRHFAATKAQREQLFQLRERRLEGSFTAEDRARARSIRQELRQAMQGIRGEMRNTLSAEQRSQMEAFREQRRQRREEMMRQRQEFRRTRPPQE